ncbi:hypothetical protein QA649_33615 [Bradyrhizobium sp. CB1717]|uniref:hypothetical protein n=1 Tax=Bradyrhizobium sp. CB1717 TaxID=3039154 RepID=UPI0024B1010E|nr:hypothetical protein [Bradyrhizobium sp. CB1717]WFU22983.1 hypothetical protein QA649_33615 [Bradyrhizobium sp. CB1717]
MMQHVSCDDVQNAEAREDGDCPGLERRRWSPGVAAIGNCHIQMTFLQPFEAKLLVLTGSVDGAAVLPPAGFKIGGCANAFN